MKNYFLLLILLLFVFADAKSQAGMWTWVSGDSVPNSPGVYGVQGVPSPFSQIASSCNFCELTKLLFV